MKTDNRDDFPDSVRDAIARKSGYRCSNPNCPTRASLIGASSDGRKKINMGIVAHIRAAAPGGARYDPTMTPQERGGEENGLFLCRHCAALVDADDTAYPPEVLHQWRRMAYQRAAQSLAMSPDSSGREGPAEDPRCWPVLSELVRVCLCTYQTQGQVSKTARFRSYAGILYRLFFEQLTEETDYGRQEQLWMAAIGEITGDVLEQTSCRVARHDRGFPRRYRYLMEELETYSFRPQEQKARALDAIETTIRELFRSGEAFGLKENNSREIF